MDEVRCNNLGLKLMV